MKINYKFWYVHKEDDIHINEVAVRFFQGDITTENETTSEKIDGIHQAQAVTRYRMSKRLQKVDLPHEKDRKVKKESSGDDCFIYTDKDFGITSDLDDVRIFLNGVLGKDKDREPEDMQKETDKVKLKQQATK
jgi:hypothetical protein